MKPRKILQIVFALSLCLSLCVPVFAANADSGSKFIEVLEDSKNPSEVTITIDDLMENSSITYADARSKSGHYKGDSQIITVRNGSFVVTPDFTWTHTVEFDWTAKLNSDGDYIFDTISNANSSVAPGSHLLYFNVGSTETRDVYWFSSDRKSVTFSSTYELQWRFYNESFITDVVAELERVVKMQDLI